MAVPTLDNRYSYPSPLYVAETIEKVKVSIHSTNKSSASFGVVEGPANCFRAGVSLCFSRMLWLN